MSWAPTLAGLYGVYAIAKPQDWSIYNILSWSDNYGNLSNLEGRDLNMSPPNAFPSPTSGKALIGGVEPPPPPAFRQNLVSEVSYMPNAYAGLRLDLSR